MFKRFPGKPTHIKKCLSRKVGVRTMLEQSLLNDEIDEFPKMQAMGELVEEHPEVSAAEFVADLERRQDDLLRELEVLNLRIEATLKEFAPNREQKEAA